MRCPRCGAYINDPLASNCPRCWQQLSTATTFPEASWPPPTQRPAGTLPSQAPVSRDDLPDDPFVLSIRFVLLAILSPFAFLPGALFFAARNLGANRSAPALLWLVAVLCLIGFLVWVVYES